MANPRHSEGLNQAFDQIERVILPDISVLLGDVLDATSLARSSKSDVDLAAELRTLTIQLETVTRQIEALPLILLGTQDAPQIKAENDRKISA